MENLNNVVYASFSGSDYQPVAHNGIVYHCFYELNWVGEYIDIQKILFNGIDIMPALQAVDDTLAIWYEAIDKATGFHEEASNLFYKEQLAAM